MVVGGGPPAWRWRARSPSSPATPCPANSAPPIRERPHPARRAADRVLTGFPPSLSARPSARYAGSASRPSSDAQSSTSTTPASTSRTADGATGGCRREQSSGPPASPPPRSPRALAEATGAEQDRAGRVTVEPNLTLPGHPEVFALGDMVRVRGRDGTAITFPGIARSPCSGALRGKAVRARLQGRTSPVPLPRQGQPGHHRPCRRRRGHQGRQAQRLPRLGDLARRPPLLLDRIPEPAPRPHPLVIGFATRGRGARLITSPPNTDTAGRPAAQPEPGEDSRPSPMR